MPAIPLPRLTRSRRMMAAFGAAAVGLGALVDRPRPCACPTPPWLCGPPVPPAGPGQPTLPAAAPADAPRLRVLIYNVHSGLGHRLTFGRPRAAVERNLERIADRIAEAAADAPIDVVGLNEVDFAARRTGDFDQAEFLARALHERTGEAYQVVRGVTRSRETPGREVVFGNAALVRLPLLRSSSRNFGEEDPAAAALPPIQADRLVGRLLREERGVVSATVAVGGHEVDLLVTHLDAFAQREREAQAVHLLRRFVAPGRTTVLMGDLNAVPGSLTGKRRLFRDDLTHDVLTAGPLADARLLQAAREGCLDLTSFATYPSDEPIWPLDGVLGTLDLVPEAVAQVGELESDHRGLLVTYRLDARPDAVAQRERWHQAVRGRQLEHQLRCGGLQEAWDREGALPGRLAWARRLLEAVGVAPDRM